MPLEAADAAEIIIGLNGLALIPIITTTSLVLFLARHQYWFII